MTLSDSQEDVGSKRVGNAPSDIFKILVATDIHLGYGEKDPNIGICFFGAHNLVKLNV